MKTINVPDPLNKYVLNNSEKFEVINKICRKALRTGNTNDFINLVPNQYARTVTEHFLQTLKIRRHNTEARKLADSHFIMLIMRLQNSKT